MLFRLALLLVLLVLLASGRAHNHDKQLRGVGEIAAKDKADPDAIKALTVQYPNPELHTNTWENKEKKLWFSQTQVFLTNTDAKRAICDVKVSVPLAKAADTKVSSSYAVDVETTKSGLEGTLPDYIKRVEPGQMVTMGFMLQSASAEGVKVTGDVKVVDAEFCDNDG